MENLQEDPDYAIDQNGKIIDLYGEPRDPKSIRANPPMNEFQKAAYAQIEVEHRKGKGYPFLK
jgi:hypothetical protein